VIKFDAGCTSQRDEGWLSWLQRETMGGGTIYVAGPLDVDLTPAGLAAYQRFCAHLAFCGVDAWALSSPMGWGEGMRYMKLIAQFLQKEMKELHDMDTPTDELVPGHLPELTGAK
jgi:hypothetical protein